MKRLVPARLLAELQPEAAARHELPADLLHAFRRRVRVAAATGAVAYALFLVVEWGNVLGASALEHRINVTHDVLGVLVCGTLWWSARSSKHDDRTVLGAALVAELLIATLISVAVPWAAFLRVGHVPRLTWVVPIVILFPLLVPAPPRTALLVSSLCALAMPAGVGGLALMGKVGVTATDYWGIALTGAVAVGIAGVASRTVHGAGRQIAAARTVGSYQLLEPVGRGGMGEVWKARHLLLSRPAAVKLILPERLQGRLEARAVALERFTREAEVIASLRSPHTVELYDFGASVDRTLYYVMELLDGLNLQHFVYRFGPVQPRRAVHWLCQACHSLGEAHARGLVHRDVKPSNLFLCRRGRDADVVKVLDFGLAKPASETDDPGLTQVGLRMGTVGYMAPEQIYGLPIGPATDLYALGCVAYWLLAGTEPFQAESPGELLALHAQSPPPPFSATAARDVPERLERIVMACMRKDPADRPHDADRLGAELAASMDGAPWSQAEANAWWEANL